MINFDEDIDTNVSVQYFLLNSKTEVPCFFPSSFT